MTTVQNFFRKVLRAAANYDPNYYDMHRDANEAFFAKLYLERIGYHAKQAGIAPGARMLEAGCQAGRFIIPFAKLGFCVTGVDTSAFAIRRARLNARKAEIKANFIRGNILDVLRGRKESFDLIICAEVVYLTKAYREILRALSAALRPGGLLCVSHRPKFYYLFEALRQYDVETAQRVLATSEGNFRGSSYYNWQTPEELKRLYEEQLKLSLLGIYPIDRLAWLSGVSPSSLADSEKEEWLNMELKGYSGATGCARYLLVIASRP